MKTLTIATSEQKKIPLIARPSSAASTHAAKLGLPPSATVVESQSRSTEQNARFAAAALPAARRIVVVSDAYHVLRCERVFGRYFDEASGAFDVPARTAAVFVELATPQERIGYLIEDVEMLVASGALKQVISHSIRSSALH